MKAKKLGIALPVVTVLGLAVHLISSAGELKIARPGGETKRISLENPSPAPVLTIAPRSANAEQVQAEAPRLEADQEQAILANRLRVSGAALNGQVTRSAIDANLGYLSALQGVNVGTPECYRDGCMVQLSIERADAYGPNMRQDLGAELKKNWNGALMVGAPIDGGNGKTSALIVWLND